MRKATLLVFTLSLVPAALFAGEPQAEVSNDIQVVRVSPRGDRAIIRGADGRMQMVKVGEEISGDDNGGNRPLPFRDGNGPSKPSGTGRHLKVVEIARDRVVIEEKTADGIKTATLQPGRRRERPGRRDVGNEQGRERKDEEAKKKEINQLGHGSNLMNTDKK